jgi:biotin carboxyl carrier protein
VIEGEFVSIPERLVLSPAWGRLRSEPLEPGRSVEVGTVIGAIRQPKLEVRLVCSVAGLFVEWLAEEGERVRPGTPLARLRSDDTG